MSVYSIQYTVYSIQYTVYSLQSIIGNVSLQAVNRKSGDRDRERNLIDRRGHGWTLEEGGKCTTKQKYKQRVREAIF